jgi:hypothetical protein
MSSGNAIMPTARAVAGETTAELTVAVHLASLDPLDTLVDRVRPLAAHSVDALEVAAALEATGVTDRVARVWFGFTDVFELAEEVRRRAPATDWPAKPAPRRRSAPWRDVSHGLIYLMPAAIFPAAVAGLGGRVAFVMAIVLTAAVGWVYSGVVAWRAYHLIGDARPHPAQRLLLWAALAAMPIGAAVAGAVVVVTGANPVVVLLAAGAMAYQIAITILVIHRREALVLAAVAPVLAAGVAYLVAGGNLRQLALAAGVASVGCLFGLALWETLARRAPVPAPGAPIRSGRRRELVMVFAYTALSAAFFLYPQVSHLANQFDVAMALLPVIAGMGVVEWRSHRFADDARALLSRVTHPRQFAGRIWLVLLNGLSICFGVVGLLAVALLGVLAATGRYTAASAFMAAAGVLLAGAYFLGFLLANLGRYRVLCVNLVLGLAAYEIARIALPGVLGNTYAFRIAAATLLVLNLIGLMGVLGDARRHR